MLQSLLSQIKKLYSTKKRLLAALFISALFVRLVFFLMVSPWQPDVVKNVVLQDDQQHLNRLSINLYQKGVLSDDSRLRPNPYRTPGFPLLAGGIYYLFGERQWIVLLFQCFMDSFTAVLIALTLLLFFTPGVVFGVTLLYVFDPGPVIHTSKLLSDPLYVFVCAAALYRTALFFKSSPARISLLIQSAVLWGLSCYVRPLSQYIPLLVIVVLIIQYKKDYKQWIKYGVVFTVVFIALLAPWMYRNSTAFGTAGFSTIGNHGLLFLHVKPILMKKFQLSRTEADSLLKAKTDSLIISAGVDQNEVYGFKKGEIHTKLAIYYIQKYPVDFLLYYLNGCVRMYISLGTAAPFEMLQIKERSDADTKYRPTGIINDISYFFREKGAAQLLLGGWTLLIYLVSYGLVLFGLYRSFRNYPGSTFLFSLLFVLYITAATGAAGALRFKLPAIPFYLQMAAFGAAGVTALIRQRTQPR